MNQNYSIFIDDNEWQLIKDAHFDTSIGIEIDGKKDAFAASRPANKIRALLKEVQKGTIKDLKLSYQNPDALLNIIKLGFVKHIIAAGGVVINDKKETLFIYRNGFWDLPKGKVEQGEQFDSTAIREIQEETGIVHVKIKKMLPTTFHTYKEGNTWVLKECRWFEMNSNDTKISPQTEEGITEIKWVKKSELTDYIAKSYKNIQGLMKYYVD